MFTNKQILAIVLPLLAQQFLTIFVGFADTLMVASVSEAAMAGVALVDQVTVLLTTVLAAMAAGGAVLISQMLGKKDELAANDFAKQLLLANVSVGLLACIVMITFSRGILNFLFGGAEEAVMVNAQKYMLVIGLGMPFLAANGAFDAILRCEGRTRITLNVAVVMNIINVVGNAIGIFVFHAGVYGVAIPTLLSHATGAAMKYYAIVHSKSNIHFQLREVRKFDFGKIRRIYAYGIPMSLENFMFQFGRVALTGLAASLGTASVAAYTASIKICNFVYLPATAISLAIPAVVGRCIGARSYGEAKKNALRFLGYEYTVMLPSVLLMSLFLPKIASWFQLSPEGTGFCVALVLVNNAVMLIRPFAFQVPDVLRSAGDVHYPMVVSIASMWIFRIGCAYLFVKVFDVGVVGIYYGMAADWCVRALFYGWRFFTNKWIEVYENKQRAQNEV